MLILWEKDKIDGVEWRIIKNIPENIALDAAKMDNITRVTPRNKMPEENNEIYTGRSILISTYDLEFADQSTTEFMIYPYKWE